MDVNPYLPDRNTSKSVATYPGTEPRARILHEFLQTLLATCVHKQQIWVKLYEQDEQLQL